MATPKIEIAPERIADGKRLYELTLTPVPDIAAMMGVRARPSSAGCTNGAGRCAARPAMRPTARSWRWRQPAWR